MLLLLLHALLVTVQVCCSSIYVVPLLHLFILVAMVTDWKPCHVSGWCQADADGGRMTAGGAAYSPGHICTLPASILIISSPVSSSSSPALARCAQHARQLPQVQVYGASWKLVYRRLSRVNDTTQMTLKKIVSQHTILGANNFDLYST